MTTFQHDADRVMAETLELGRSVSKVNHVVNHGSIHVNHGSIHIFIVANCWIW